MKLHETLIERIISLSETYGGHRNERRLKEELKKLNISVYVRQTGARRGEQVLVDQVKVDEFTRGQ